MKRKNAVTNNDYCICYLNEDVKIYILLFYYYINCYYNRPLTFNLKKLFRYYLLFFSNKKFDNIYEFKDKILHKITRLNLSSDKFINEFIKGIPLIKLNLKENYFITNKGIKGKPIQNLNLSNNEIIKDKGIQEMP